MVESQNREIGHTRGAQSKEKQKQLLDNQRTGKERQDPFLRDLGWGYQEERAHKLNDERGLGFKNSQGACTYKARAEGDARYSCIET